MKPLLYQIDWVIIQTIALWKHDRKVATLNGVIVMIENKTVQFRVWNLPWGASSTLFTYHTLRPDPILLSYKYEQSGSWARIDYLQPLLNFRRSRGYLNFNKDLTTIFYNIMYWTKNIDLNLSVTWRSRNTFAFDSGKNSTSPGHIVPRALRIGSAGRQTRASRPIILIRIKTPIITPRKNPQNRYIAFEVNDCLLSDATESYDWGKAPSWMTGNVHIV